MTMSMDRTCVIYNPVAGRGKTLRELRKVHHQFPGVDFRASRGPGHAEELAHVAALAGYQQVIAAGGDGTVHEVANGIIVAGQPNTVFSVWPLGSSNDYAFTLGLTNWWRGSNRRRPTETRQVDIGRVTAPNGKQRYFVNGFGLGFNGAVTVEARKIRMLRGLPLYATAVLKAMWWHFQQPIMRVKFDEIERELPTLAITVNLAQREGGFPLMPNASLEDGLFDCMHVGSLSRRELVGFMPAMATGTLPMDHAKLWMQRCQRVSIQANEPFRIHLDGEFFCHPEDGLTAVTVELIPARLAVKTFRDDGAQ